jgi:glycerol-3-phosphate dehydrogenase
LPAPDGTTVTLRARGLVNACGPWVKHFLDEQTVVKTPKRVRLIKGSHIIVPRLHDGDHAFILQNKDNRVAFVIPYERAFSLIGTTDIPVEAARARSARKTRSPISASWPATTWQSRCAPRTWCGPIPACGRCSMTATTIRPP